MFTGLRRLLAHFNLPVALIAALIVGLATPFQAEAQADFDPAYIPAQLKARNLDACGTRIALDPSWPVARTPKQGGAQYKVSLSTDYYSPARHIGNEIVVNPMVRVWVMCGSTTLENDAGDKFFKRYTDGVRDYAVRDRDLTAGPMQTYDAPGFGQVHFFSIVRRTPKGGLTDGLRAVTIHRGKDIMLDLEVFRSPPRNCRTVAKRGEVLTERGRNGAAISVRLASPVCKMRDNSHWPTRSAAENQQFLQAILRSFRGI